MSLPFNTIYEGWVLLQLHQHHNQHQPWQRPLLGHTQCDSSLATCKWKLGWEVSSIHPCECPMQEGHHHQHNRKHIWNSFEHQIETNLQMGYVVSVVDGAVEWGGGATVRARQTIPVELLWHVTFCFMPLPLARKVSVVQNQMTSSRSPNWNSLEHGFVEGPCFNDRERYR